MKNLKIESVENATVRVSNASDESRKAEITASVTYNRDKMQSVSNGEVREDGSEFPVASFDQYGEDNLNIRWNQKSKNLSRTEILEIVESFIAEANEQNPTDSLLNSQN